MNLPEKIEKPVILFIYYPKDENWNRKFYIASTELLSLIDNNIIYIGTYIQQQEELPK